MKKIFIPHYQCEFCDKIFELKWECDLHERERHKCPTCIHSYYVYGCELNCELENNKKRCKYKSKK